MICRKCGCILDKGTKICPFCEEPAEPGTEDLMPYISKADKQKKWLFGTVGMAVISLILAAIGLLR